MIATITRIPKRKILLVMIPLVYALSFLLPALDDAPGWTVFLLGILGCVLAPLSALDGLSKVQIGLFVSFAWVANPLLWGAYWKQCAGAPGKGLKSALWALILAGAFGAYSFFAFAAGGSRRLPGPGYWLWLTSMSLAVIAAYSAEDNQRRWLPSNEFIHEALRHVGSADATPGPADDRIRTPGQYQHVCRGPGG